MRALAKLPEITFENAELVFATQSCSAHAQPVRSWYITGPAAKYTAAVMRPPSPR